MSLTGPNREPSARVYVSVWPMGPGRVGYGVSSTGPEGDELTTAEVARVLRAAADYCELPDDEGGRS